MSKDIYKITVNEGKVFMPQKADFQSRIESLKDGEYALTLKRVFRARTHRQNRYYWFIMGLVAAEQGYDDPEDVHTAMRLKFLLDRSSKAMPYIRSTTSLDTAEMTTYMDSVIRFIEDPVDGLGIHVPSPEEALIMNYIL